MVSYRKDWYFILYRLKGSEGSWFPYYRRRYTKEVANRKFNRLLSLDSPFEFVIVSEPGE